MGRYATANDVRAVLAPASAQDQPGSAASMADTDILQAVDEAQSLVDSSLSGRYYVPFDINPDGSVPVHTWPDGTTHPVPFLVFQVTRDIAAYKATSTYRQGQPLEPTHPVWLRYRDAVGTASAPGTLDRLRTGSVTLSVEPAGQADRGGETGVLNPTPDRQHDMWLPEELGLSSFPGGRTIIRQNPF